MQKNKEKTERAAQVRTVAKKQKDIMRRKETSKNLKM